MYPVVLDAEAETIIAVADEIGADFAEGRRPAETGTLLALFSPATVLRGIDVAIAQGEIPPGDHDYHLSLLTHHRLARSV